MNTAGNTSIAVVALSVALPTMTPRALEAHARRNTAVQRDQYERVNPTMKKVSIVLIVTCTPLMISSIVNRDAEYDATE